MIRLGGADAEGTPSWLEQTGTGSNGTAKPIDTSSWFDSHLPPAAEQPEAANLRASDLDAATLEAHSGLPDEDDLPLPDVGALPTVPEPPVPVDPTQWSTPTQQGTPPHPTPGA